MSNRVQRELCGAVPLRRFEPKESAPRRAEGPVTRRCRDLVACSGGGQLPGQFRFGVVRGSNVKAFEGGLLDPGAARGSVCRPLPAAGSRTRPHRVLISPPSIVKSAPVMFAARGEARKTTRSATSSGVVNRPVSTLAAVRSMTS